MKKTKSPVVTKTKLISDEKVPSVNQSISPFKNKVTPKAFDKSARASLPVDNRSSLKGEISESKGDAQHTPFTQKMLKKCGFVPKP